MNVEITVGGAVPPQRNYLTWTPQSAAARVINGPGAGTVEVTMRSSGSGGQVQFGMTASAVMQDVLTLQLPGDGTPLQFFVAGKFGFPSSSDGDAVIQAIDATS